MRRGTGVLRIGAFRFGASLVLSLIGIALLPTPGAQALAPLTPQGWSSEEGRWIPPAKFQFPDGWKTFPRGATYKPCQTIHWHFRRDNEPANRSTMVNDVREALVRIEAWTGVKFKETAESNGADLSFGWNPSDYLLDPETAGVAQPITGLYYGSVLFSSSNSFTMDAYAGYGPAASRQTGPLPAGALPGRQALVIHEVLHAMGFDHVDDPTSIMFPYFDAASPGVPNTADIDGMRVVYKDNKCPDPVPTADAVLRKEGQAYVQARILKRGTKVESICLKPDGDFSGHLQAKIPDGKRARVLVTGANENGKWVDSRYKSRAAKGGIIRFNVPVTLYDYVVIRDHKGRFLARFTTDHQPRPIAGDFCS